MKDNLRLKQLYYKRKREYGLSYPEANELFSLLVRYYEKKEGLKHAEWDNAEPVVI